jgi:hypothetical protein
LYAHAGQGFVQGIPDRAGDFCLSVQRIGKQEREKKTGGEISHLAFFLVQNFSFF